MVPVYSQLSPEPEVYSQLPEHQFNRSAERIVRGAIVLPYFWEWGSEPVIGLAGEYQKDRRHVVYRVPRGRIKPGELPGDTAMRILRNKGILSERVENLRLMGSDYHATQYAPEYRAELRRGTEDARHHLRGLGFFGLSELLKKFWWYEPGFSDVTTKAVILDFINDSNLLPIDFNRDGKVC